LATSRDDSDAADDRFRLYEVPGAPRMDRIYFQHIPVVEDQIKAGQPVTVGKWPYNYTCTPDIDLLDFQAKRYVINGALANLDSWVRTGTPPPRAAGMHPLPLPSAPIRSTRGRRPRSRSTT
jgi:hypothetical protein